MRLSDSLIDEVTANAFYADYSRGRTWADADRALEAHLTHEQQVELRDSLETVKELTGLDGRQSFLLGILRSVCALRESGGPEMASYRCRPASDWEWAAEVEGL
jgi:hypothetical protein